MPISVFQLVRLSLSRSFIVSLVRAGLLAVYLWAFVLLLFFFLKKIHVCEGEARTCVLRYYFYGKITLRMEID